MGDSRVTRLDAGSVRTRQRALSRRGLILVGLLVGTGLQGQSGDAAERTGPVKIGALTQSWGATPQMVGLRDGLLALGYREGEQFVIGVRFTQGDASLLPEATQALIRDGADILFPTDAHSARAAQKATTRIPIVFAAVVGDPVELGLVRSVARPGGNITGITDGELDLNPKRLEIFKDMIPGLKRVLYPYDPTDADAAAAARAYRLGARQLGVVLVEKPVRTEAEARAALSRLRKGGVDGIIAPPSLSLNILGVVLDATTQLSLPTMFNAAFMVERGGLVSYGSDWYDTGRQAARLVDKIVKGEDPGRIPVETNPKVELAINVKTAKMLKLAIPPSVLQRASRLIE
jgi:putative tryptophan/tyrosine transport system substrate-binding protein